MVPTQISCTFFPQGFFSGLRSNRICFFSSRSALLAFRISVAFLLYFCIYRLIVLYVIYCILELVFPSLTGTKIENLFGVVGQMHLLQCKIV